MQVKVSRPTPILKLNAKRVKIIRVLHVITTLGRGGAERQLVNLVNNTTPGEFEHLICYLHPPGDFELELKQAGHKVVCMDLPRRAPWLFAPLSLIPILKRFRPNVVQTWLYEADFAVRLSVPRKSIPIVNTLHMPTYEPETIAAGRWPNWKMQTLRQIDRITARWAKPLFIAVSDTVRKSAVKQLGVPPSDVRIIYNSIDLETLKSSPGASEKLRADLDIPSDGFVFLNVARLAPQKGQAQLLDAFHLVALQNSNTYLVFAGDGPLRKELEALADSLGVSERVRFLGRREDVGTCLELGNAFVFPSLFEGLPLAPVEAMLKGLPCIATKIGSLEEIITNRENGILVPLGAVAELAQAMTEICNDKELRNSLASRAQVLAYQRFERHHGLMSWENLYREVAKTN